MSAESPNSENKKSIPNDVLRNGVKKTFTIVRHVVAFAILVFFVASFFIGVNIDPSYVDIARSPYGIFTYFIITSLTIFIPSIVTLPIVTTATIIWNPWIAGIIAVIGWTLGGIVEYYAAYFAMGSFRQFINTKEMDKKLERVRKSITFWQLSLARVFVPAFIFGMAKTNIWRYTWASIVAYIPLAIGGVAAGTVLRELYEQNQPILVGVALVILIFTLDYFFVHRGGKSAEKA